MNSFDDVRPKERENKRTRWLPRSYHGLDALNLRFCATTFDLDEAHHIYKDWSVVSIDPKDTDKVQFGWTAGWNPASITPDISMSSLGTSEDKELMAKALKQFYGLYETACVLPDDWDFEQVGSFIRSLPNMWYIWSSVALALYMSSQKKY